MRQALKMSVFCLISWSQFSASYPELITRCVQWISNTSEEFWCSDAKAIFLCVCVCVCVLLVFCWWYSVWIWLQWKTCHYMQRDYSTHTQAQFNHISLSLSFPLSPSTSINPLAFSSIFVLQPLINVWNLHKNVWQGKICERFTLPKYKMLGYCFALRSRCKEVILLDGVAYSFVAVVRMEKGAAA